MFCIKYHKLRKRSSDINERTETSIRRWRLSKDNKSKRHEFQNIVISKHKLNHSQNYSHQPKFIQNRRHNIIHLILRQWFSQKHESSNTNKL